MLIEMPPVQPIVNVKSAQTAIGGSDERSRLALNRLEEAGVLEQVTLGKRNRVWEAVGLYEALDGFEEHLATLGPVRCRLRAVPRIALLATAAALVIAAPASAATVNVQNQNDSGNGSLRKAIADANPNDEVLVPPGTYNLTSGELDVGINLTIIGAGAGAGSGSTIINAGGKSRVFNIHDGSVTLKDLRVTGGKDVQGAGIRASSTTNLERVVVAGNVAGGNNVLGEGGGIAVSGPQLNLLDSSVTGNRAGGGGLVGTGLGGGITVLWATSASRTITLTRSAVSGNRAGGGGGQGVGGGIHTETESNNSTLNLTLTQSTVAGNATGGGGGSGFGGGIEAGSGANNGGDITVTLDRSTVSGNRAGGENRDGNGGGVELASGANILNQTLNVTNSTISGNAAGGGGVDGDGIGGGINLSGSGSGGTHAMNLTHTTVANNRAGGQGGSATGSGVAVEPAATTILRNSIVSANPGSNCDQPFDSTSHNIEDTNTCGLDTLDGDKPNTGPKLNPLGNYGGPTQTMLPKADSLAIDNAEGLYCSGLTTDQRGVGRPVGPECDIGSVEVQRADVGVTATRTPKTVSAGKVVTYRFAAKNNGPQVAPGVTLIDKLPAKLKLLSVGGCTGKLATGCVIGTIPFGATKTVTIKARARRSGKVTNTGRVMTFAADPKPGNNAASTTVTVLPSLTKLTMQPKTWPVGGKTTIRFTLSDPGQVTLSFARKGKDGKFHKVGARKVSGKRGKNKLSFDGDLDGGKSLSAGRYRLTARVKDAGGRRSKRAKLTFKVTS
jgi:uncharacterized repeat protein (TIGR01451 family)